MEELLDHAWSGRLAAASVTVAKVEVISAIGLSLAALPRNLQVVQCSGWRQRCGLDRVDDCSHGRQQGVDPGEQRADSFHPDHVHVAREPRHEAHEPRDLFTRSCSIHQRVYLVPKELDEKVRASNPGHPGEFFVGQGGARVPFCALQAWRLSCLRSTSLFPQRVASTSSVSKASVGNTGHFDNEIDFTGSEGWKA